MPIRTYTALTFIVTWSIVLTSYAFYSNGFLSVDQLNLPDSLGVFGTLLAAIITAKIYYGKRGVKKLFF